MLWLYILANPSAEPCTITSPAPVVFSGGYFTGAWNNGLTITAEGYKGGVETGTVTATVNYNGPAWIDLTPLGTIDKLVLSSAGGTNAGGQGWGEHFALDDLKIQAGSVTTYTVTPSAGTGGSIDPADPQTVNSGDVISFTVTPNTGYSIANVEGCGGSLSGNVYTTAPVTADCAVTASFKINTYTVTPSAGAGGSISPDSPQSVEHGSAVSFEVTPSTGYAINTVEGCGGSLSGNVYTTAPVTADCAVTASFVINTYTVTPSAGAGGSISPSAPQTVNHGSAASFTVTPDTGYSIDKVEGCGGALSGSTYNTAPVTENCTVKASFIKLKKHFVIPLAGPNGTISPRRPQLAPHGSTVSFTVTPAAGYAVRSVFGCGGALSGNSYTTGPISRNCAVVASFARIRRHFVIPSAGRHGSISPDSPQQALHGATASFTVTPHPGCRISKVTGCGGTLNGSIYTTAAVTRSCRVHAAFVK